MANIVDTASAVVVVWGLDVITAHIGSFVTDLQDTRSQLVLGDGRSGIVVACIAFGCSTTDLDLIETAIVHAVCKLGV